MSVDNKDKRIFARYGLSAFVTTSRQRESFLFSLRNISQGGCFVAMPDNGPNQWIHEGQFVDVVVYNNNQSENLHFMGQVVWTRDLAGQGENGFGVAIRAISGENLTRLGRLIDKLAVDKRPTTPLAFPKANAQGTTA